MKVAELSSDKNYRKQFSRASRQHITSYTNHAFPGGFRHTRDQANDALGLLKQIAIVLTKHNSIPVGKEGEKVSSEFSITAWDEDGPWKAFNNAYELCFQKGQWCPEPKENITRGPHGIDASDQSAKSNFS